MAFNFKYTRHSALCQFMLGGLCFIFGIADRATMYKREAFQTEGLIAIWMGAWFLITGGLGFFATQHVPNSNRPKTSMLYFCNGGVGRKQKVLPWIGQDGKICAFPYAPQGAKRILMVFNQEDQMPKEMADISGGRTKGPNEKSFVKVHQISVYLAFSIVATVFAGVMIICYSIGIAIILKGSSCSFQSRYVRQCSSYSPCTYLRISQVNECRTSVGLGAMIIIFAIVEFGVGIWASVCCCMAYNDCCCDTSTPEMQGPVVYLQTQGATGPVATYVMTQGPNGIAMAVPAMATAGVYPVANQAGGQVYMQNPQGATAMVPTQQGVPTLVAQQPASQTPSVQVATGTNQPSSGHNKL